MFTLQGRYGTATVYADIIDQKAISQIIQMMNQPFVENQKVYMMPDAHAGKGCTIGTTMTVSDKICPNLVGVDIGCGMLAIKLHQKDISWSNLDQVIREHIPSGLDVAANPRPEIKNCRVDDMICAKTWSFHAEAMSLGTLGGGNHFIEVDQDSDGHLWLVIHSGSRHLGVKVATYYQRKAIKAIHAMQPWQLNELRDRLRQENRLTEFNQECSKMTPQWSHIPDDFCWCEGRLMDDYLHDMQIVQEFADQNRRAIARIILEKMNLGVEDQFSTVHNYLDMDSMILRKGAVSAQTGQRLLIPISMKDGALLCTGKGNPDWNFSAPHGAGRLMSRKDAKETLTVDEFTAAMTGIWTSSICEATLNESPMAYKPMDAILNTIQDTAEVQDILRPKYNYKAH